MLAQVVAFDLRGGRGELLVTTPDEVYQDDTVGPSEPFKFIDLAEAQRLI